MDNTDLRHHCYAMGYSDGEVGAFYDGYEQGKADAIDEGISKIDKLTTYYAGDKEGNAITPKVVIKEDVIKVLEQLKEQK